MKLLRSLVRIGLVTIASLASAADGLVEVKSPYRSIETMNRLEAVVMQCGLAVFARIDDAAGAAKVGKSLRAT